jgi:hypothetical protein
MAKIVSLDTLPEGTFVHCECEANCGVPAFIGGYGKKGRIVWEYSGEQPHGSWSHSIWCPDSDVKIVEADDAVLADFTAWRLTNGD